MLNDIFKKRRSGITVGELVPMLDKDCRISISFDGAATPDINWENPLTRHVYADLVVAGIVAAPAKDGVLIELEIAANPRMCR